MNSELSLRYASALYSLALDENSLESYQEEIKEIKKVILDNHDFITLISSSFLSKEEKLDIVKKIFASINKNILNFFLLIIDKNRGIYLLDILNCFNSLCNENRGIKEGIVYSTYPLNEKEIHDITKVVSKKESCSCELYNRIDPNIIGGVKVVINNHVYDGSIKNKIENMRTSLLTRRNTHEN